MELSVSAMQELTRRGFLKGTAAVAGVVAASSVLGSAPAAAVPGGVIVSGDTHLAALVRHSEGPVQFSGPGASTSCARWFEPDPPLANPGPHPYTGDFTDHFGNMRVLAVANPRVSQAFWLENYGLPNIG